MMDTVTVVIHGQIIDLCDQMILPAIVKLKNQSLNLQAKADSTGSFRFIHIPYGQYSLSSEFIGHHKLNDTLISLGSGDIWELSIGLGCEK